MAVWCIDGSKTKAYHIDTEYDACWKLSFSNDAAITCIVIYSRSFKRHTAGNIVYIKDAEGNTMGEHAIEDELKSVYVIPVVNITGQYLKIQNGGKSRLVAMREVIVFDRYD